MRTSISRSAPAVLPALQLALALLAGCDQAPLVPVPCEGDPTCPAPVPRPCGVDGGAALLQPGEARVDFGALTGAATRARTLTLSNLGTCPLTLFEARLADPRAGFECDLCAGPFPRELFPGRSLEVELAYAPGAPGPAGTALLLRSDDPQFPLLQVPLSAEALGTPRLLASPATVDFGYLAQGRQATRTVLLTNQGSGRAPVVVTGAAVAGGEDGGGFSLASPGPWPRALGPYALDRAQALPLELRFAPRTAAAQAAELVLATDQGELRVPLAGTAATPPAATLAPASLDLGEIALGTTVTRPLTVVNQGGAALELTATWPAGTSTDLAVSPTRLPPLASGAQAALQVSLTPTRLGPLGAALEVATNDPRHPSVAVAVRGTGVPGPAASVVKLDVTTNPGGSGAFTDDVRKVEATLESPAGRVCNKATPAPEDWGAAGRCAYLTLGAMENPQRFVLAGAAEDGTWRLTLTYARDCASLPTGLAAALLGITLDVLQAALNGGVVLVPGQDLAQVVQNLCLSHQPSAVQITVFVDGVLVAQKTATVGQQGDATVALELERAGGAFSAR